MPATIGGLPLHPLVVHAVVVLLPAGILGVIALAVRPSLRGRFGWLVVAVTALATAAIPLATESGESLEARVGDPGEHAELGDSLIFFALPLLVAAVALVWTHRRTAAGRSLAAAVRHGIAVLSVLIALAGLVQVYRVGESGARAVWGNTPAASAPR